MLDDKKNEAEEEKHIGIKNNYHKLKNEDIRESASEIYASLT